MDSSDVELFNRIRAGDANAFAELYAKYGRLVLQALTRAHVPDRDLEDVAQEAFIYFFRKVINGDVQPINIAAYLWRCAGLKALDYHKKVQRTPSTPIEEPDTEIKETSATTLEKLEQDELREAVLEALRKLNPDQREAFIMKELEEFTYEEISNISAIKVSTAKMRVFRAKQTLTRLLKNLRPTKKV